MAQMRCFYRLGVRDFANLIAVLISLEPLQRRSHRLSPDVLSCSIMLVAAVVPSTKVVTDLFPLSLRSIPRGTKRAAPAPLRCASPSVCKGLSQLQSDHHCNANKEKSNDHELHQIHKRRYRNSKRRRVHFNPNLRPRHHSRTHRQQQPHGTDAPRPWPLPSRQTGRMWWHLEEAEQGHRL